MAICVLAFFVFAFLSIFSAKYRPLAKESFRCVFRTLMLKPCDTGLDERIKTKVVGALLKRHKGTAKFVNRHFTLLSWIFVALTFVSFAYSAMGVYNFYVYGNCNGPDSTEACILNDITGDYGRFSSPQELIPPSNLSGLSEGNPEAKVKVIEFGCFTCPYTKKAEPIVKELLKEYGDEIYYVFKPFPLPNHENSKPAAKAVLCAAEQGKQWELRDAIFKTQELCITNGSLAIDAAAKSAGLDMELFEACMQSEEMEEELNAYIEQGKEAHIYATPTFFINGKPIIGPKPIEEFKKAIDEELR